MFKEFPKMIANEQTISHIGKIENIVGMTIEASGDRATIGDIGYIYSEHTNKHIPAEVVGFKENRILLMPYENISGISSGSFLRNSGQRLKICVSDDLRGKVIDAMGRPIDEGVTITGTQHVDVDSKYTNPLNRPPIEEKLEFGVKAIDGILSVGKGQRIGIFAGSGVGKSTLLGMIAKNVQADINVIALVGERGREVREFIEKDLGEEGLKRSVLVVATSDQPAMLRLKCPMVATAIAEYFKDQGKDVLLMMDSLTRFAMAQREVGLAIGEPPIARGYTPSIYAEMPKLLERTGRFSKGSITGVYTVLVEGDDTNEPIADIVRGILDGHIVLSRRLANENHFPAIDINASISRLMSTIADPEHQMLASKLRDIASIYDKNLDLISIGAYKHGTNPRLDYAISKIDQVNSFLKQGTKESFSIAQSIAQLREIFSVPASGE